MAAAVEKMATDVSQGKPRRGKKSSNATKKRDPSVCSPSPSSSEVGKENRGVPVVSLTPSGKKNKETLKNVSNIVATPPPSLEEELLAVRMRLQKLNLEKEKTEKMLEERDAMLKEKEAELELKGKAQEKLQMEFRRLQKLKEFKPVISLPLEQPLRMGELAMEKEKKNKKKKSDPNRPKRPSAPYMVWVHDQWNQVKSENPNSAFKDMGAILGAKWKSLSAEEKRPYEEKYEADKEAYLQVVGQEKRQSEAFKLLHEEQKHKTALDLLEQYLEYRKDADGDEKSKRKKEKDPSKPKQPISAFFAFSNERRAALLAEKKQNLLEVSKILGLEWNSMTKEQRAPYEKIAMEAKEQYTQEMESYKQKKAEEESATSKEEEEKRKIEKEEAMRLLRKKEKEEKLKKTMNVQLQQKRQQREKSTDPDKPKKPSTSFLLFSKATRKKLVEERPGIDNKTISTLISVKWKELNDVEKRVWEDQAANAMVQYKMEMEKYKKLKQQTPSGGILCNPEEMEVCNSSVTTTIS